MVLRTYIKSLRRDSTPTEDLLWRKLRNRKLLNTKFRRQHPIGPFIVDLFCIEHKLIIEIDGSIHYETDKAREHDKSRQAYLEARGYRVLRFTTYDIQNAMADVLESIAQAVTPHPGSAHLLPEGEGE